MASKMVEEENGSMLNRSSSQRHGTMTKCRSLICDPTGIIIAEMIYRCLICHHLCETVQEARLHYQQEHMSDTESDLDQPAAQSTTSTTLGGGNTGTKARSSSTATAAAELYKDKNIAAANRLLAAAQHQQQQQSATMPRLHHSNQQQQQRNSLLNHSSSSDMANSLYQDMLKAFASSASGNQISSALSALASGQHRQSQSPAASTVQNGNSGGGGGSSSTKSGYVTCAVCDVTRYYSCVQRRYGQFTCVTCYRYFRTFLLKPKRYACPNLGECPLNVRTRCRACWIKACISVFTVDARRQAVIANNMPVKRAGNSATSAAQPSQALPQLQQQTAIDYSLLALKHGKQKPSAEHLINNSQSASALAGFAHENGHGSPSNSFSGDESKEFDDDDAAGEMMLEPEVNIMEEGEQDGDEMIDEPDMTASPLSAEDKDGGDERVTTSLLQQSLGSPMNHHIGRGSHNNNNSLLVQTGKKVWSCGKCETCTAEDCGKCVYCLDRPKFGGPFIKKQRCVKRRCLMKAGTRHRNPTMLNNSIIKH